MSKVVGSDVKQHTDTDTDTDRVRLRAVWGVWIELRYGGGGCWRLLEVAGWRWWEEILRGGGWESIGICIYLGLCIQDGWCTLQRCIVSRRRTQPAYLYMCKWVLEYRRVSHKMMFAVTQTA